LWDLKQKIAKHVSHNFGTIGVTIEFNSN